MRPEITAQLAEAQLDLWLTWAGEHFDEKASDCVESDTTTPEPKDFYPTDGQKQE